MRKVLVILFAIVALIFGAQNIYAADSAFKNTLLKVEITKNSETSYDIALYTQKTYNEPVQVIQKSDNIYYFLLPETNHSVTSVPPIGAITNVIIKTYPYAGQDVKNGYTKVALMTTKPVDFTTTLKTVDSSISPRLDPSRLARLDEVFAKYADRLAQNDIPSPLHQFKRVVSSQAPVIQQVQAATKPAAQVKNEAPKKAASVSNKTNSLDEYQNKSNKEQAAKKNQAASKPVKQVTSANKQAQASVKKAQTQPKQQQTQTVQKVSKPSAKTVTNPVQKQQTVNSDKQIQTKKETAPISAPIKAETKTKTNNEQVTAKQIEAQAEQDKKIEEFEKQLPTKEPVNAEFKEETKNETAKEAVKEEVTASANNEEETLEESDIQKEAPDLKMLLTYISLFCLFMGAYAYLRIKRKNAQKAQTALYDDDPNNVQELLNRIKKQNSNQEIQMADSAEQQSNDEIVLGVQDDNETMYSNQAGLEEHETEVYQPQSVEQDNEVSQEEDEAEKIAAFNNYMDSIQDGDIVEEPVVITPETKDDEIIQQLYTPIETPAYEEYNEPVSYEEPVSSEDNDVATIVSSSKLTETRGLYLAKFEGSTSLVGYIQDDIYVLYNFGEEEVSETKIESNLAEETDTDSLYIVKTGGKKLMVKSTPYDMSLEMVM